MMLRNQFSIALRLIMKVMIQRLTMMMTLSRVIQKLVLSHNSATDPPVLPVHHTVDPPVLPVCTVDPPVLPVHPTVDPPVLPAHTVNPLVLPVCTVDPPVLPVRTSVLLHTVGQVASVLLTLH